ncbi:serine/threonine protein kinase [Nocardia sp. NBC_00565]|uniref:serine/threonine-protein kinase n=1 Tax=Nocardia sp. NBC_00565 TaxID=2975993 RepID=UPI002E80062F|nr:serine/threonine-protein kinase [Nocardia sp. NBC_00565]WUC04467.1 serine/threonine protein kinase [Nocardia sp. NBC_00565]
MVNTRDVTISRRFGVGAIDTGQLIAEHYRLVERIGSGGTGVVWRAIDERLQRSVAVKQIHIKPSLPEAERDVVRQRAIREARNAARFQHPNAIVVFDITEHDGDPCLVMEYLKSKSLAGVISAQGMLPLSQVARIGEQVASALIAAHHAGIVHRDVKPGNILLDDIGTVKITDFGISRATGDVTLTETGLICGTAAYLAPEVARGSDPTPAADVFALGATLFHALEGEPPYGASANPLAVLYAAANGQVSEPRHAGPATDFLLDLLSPEPTDRPTMRAAREHLSALADSGSAPVHAGFVPASEAFGRRGESATRALRPPANPMPEYQPTERQPRPAPPPRNSARPNNSDAHPRTAAHPRTTQQPRPVRRKSGGKRKAVLIGATIGAVVAVAAILIGALNQSGTNTPSVQASPPSSSASSRTSVAATPGVLGQTPSTGTVDIGPAAQLVVDFYSNTAGSWSMLTPAAQKVYGSESAFKQYWGSRTIDTFSDIDAPSRKNNADGSVDMRLASLTVNGQTKQLMLRVISSSGGKLLIDSDTRSGDAR